MQSDEADLRVIDILSAIFTFIVSAAWKILLLYAGEDEKTSVRNAFRHWEDNTCVRFQEVDQSSTVASSHLIVTRASSGSASATFDCRNVLLQSGACVLWHWSVSAEPVRTISQQ